MTFSPETDGTRLWRAGVPAGLDAWIPRMRGMPAAVMSRTVEGQLDWPGGATAAGGDAAAAVARLKQESDVPLRSHGSRSLNRALLAAGLVELIYAPTLRP